MFILMSHTDKEKLCERTYGISLSQRAREEGEGGEKPRWITSSLLFHSLRTSLVNFTLILGFSPKHKTLSNCLWYHYALSLICARQLFHQFCNCLQVKTSYNFISMYLFVSANTNVYEYMHATCTVGMCENEWVYVYLVACGRVFRIDW